MMRLQSKMPLDARRVAAHSAGGAGADRPVRQPQHEHPMSMDVSRTRIHALQAERREARVRGLAYAAGALPVVALAAAHLLGARAAVLATLCAAAACAFWLNRAAGSAARERGLVDELILQGWSEVEPDAVARRVRELTSPRVRKAIARALEAQALGEPMPLAIVTTRLRADPFGARERLSRIAAQLRDARTPVDPRGVVLAARLVVDEAGRPSSALPPARLDERLARVERTLAPR